MNRNTLATSASLAVILLFVATALCADILITDHGAVGNDNTDDLAAFTAAIGAANSGDVVRVPAGTFLISNSILIKKSNIALIGAGDSSIIKVTTKNSLISMGPCTDVEVAYLLLEGNNISTQGIVVAGSSRLKIHHLNVRNLPTSADVFGPMGIYMSSNVNDSHIYNNTFYNIAVGADYGSGIRMSWGSNRNLLEYNTVDLTGRGGIFCSDNSNYNVIRRNTITRSGQKTEGLGIEAWGNCNMTLIENNHVDHWISVDNSHFCAVRNNIVSDHNRELALGLEAVAVTHGVFTDNQVLDGQFVGLSLSNSRRKEYAFFAYNTFNKAVLWGAQLQGETGGIYSHYLYKNTFSNTQNNNSKSPYPNDDGHGFRFNGNTFWTVLEENSIVDNGGLGIQVYGPVNGLEFINNVITGNQGSVISGSPGNQSEWQGNTVASNGNNNVPNTRGIDNQRPTPHFSYSVNDLTVTFKDESTDSDGSIVELLWDFNDGLPTSDPNPTHTYPSAGSYRVTLLAWDDGGRGARYEQVIQVGNSNTAPSSTPQASSNPNTGVPSASVTSGAEIFRVSLVLALVVLLLKLLV